MMIPLPEPVKKESVVADVQQYRIERTATIFVERVALEISKMQRGDASMINYQTDNMIYPVFRTFIKKT